MSLPLFKLEDYLSEREFTSKYMLCTSDVETHSLAEILAMSNSESQSLWQNLRLQYTEPSGHPLLKEEIAKLYNTNITSNHIHCFAGAEEGIYCLIRTLLTSADHAIVVTPCYQSHLTLTKTMSHVTELPLKYEEEWQLNFDELKNAIRSNTKLIIINYPHNPTGALISISEQEELIKICRKYNIWLFSDEVYQLLEINPTNTLQPVANLYEKGISLGVMSKAYGLPGLRVGWIACQDKELLKKIGDYKHYLSIAISAPSEVLALIALQKSKKIIERNLNLVRTNLAILDKFFVKHSDIFQWVRPKGGCVGFPKLNADIEIEQFAENLRMKTGVLILPGNVFDVPGNFFRISFGKKNMPEVLEVFSSYLAD